MTGSETASATPAGVLTAWDALGHPAPSNHASAVILICEHASNRLASPWTDVAPAILSSHAASDLGALGLAQELGPHLARAHGGAELIHAPLSRVIYDLNRSPDRPDACPERSEIHHIPMNAGLSRSERLTRVEQLYLPFHDLVRARISRALALGSRPAILTIHSFSPTWHGIPRALEFGIIHDALPALAQAILAAVQGLGLTSALNEPYSAADHVTHTLRLHALPYGLENAMLEIRNDLIATQAAQTALAGRLATALTRAIKTVTEAPCPAP